MDLMTYYPLLSQTTSIATFWVRYDTQGHIPIKHQIHSPQVPFFFGCLRGGSSHLVISKWFITAVIKTPKDRVIPLPNGLNCLQMGMILSSYKSWDDPPSRGSIHPLEVLKNSPENNRIWIIESLGVDG